ncbi:hypothetical protein [Spirosoma endbachense]|uniref:Uncharacterized protein n=1 Tax=Spirosoma endbachense TaxID=2666025 RepID=A0A6P1W5Q9_9BACT|nr:hypothetical protein [Spirosoma endbachense]QHW00235.1 hypothetical protein GJR95_36745 [Spirosoma endbachense]
MPINGLFAPSWLINPFIFSLFLFGVPRAQSQPNVQDAAVLPDSAKGYWRVYTDYNTGLTRISFYTTEHELLYQEKMKDRYIKLTKRTIAQFNELLAKLVDGHLVADRIKSYDLLVSTHGIDPPRFLLPEVDEPPTDSPQTPSNQLLVNLLPVQDKKVRLCYSNPAQQHLLVSIKDEFSHYMYRARSLAKTNSELFNLSQLPPGRYRFDIDSGQNTIQYSLVIPEGDDRIELNRVSSPSTGLTQPKAHLP